MSGAAGLSAARRRRAGAQQNHNQVISINEQSRRNVAPRARGKISVQSILENHELRLREIEPKIESIIDGTLNVSSKNENDNVNIDAGILDSVATNSNNLKVFSKKVEVLDGVISDLQTVILRLSNKVSDLHDNAVQSANVLLEVTASDDATVGSLEEVSLGSIDEVNTNLGESSDNVQQTDGTSSGEPVETTEGENNEVDVEGSIQANEQ
jgi:hypothetical protein